MQDWEIAAREAIRDLVARYNANGDSGRFDPMLELFAEEAVMELPDGEHAGRTAIRAMLSVQNRAAAAGITGKATTSSSPTLWSPMTVTATINPISTASSSTTGQPCAPA